VGSHRVTSSGGVGCASATISSPERVPATRPALMVSTDFTISFDMGYSLNKSDESRCAGVGRHLYGERNDRRFV
jgi:hypothetical protein